MIQDALLSSRAVQRATQRLLDDLPVGLAFFGPDLRCVHANPEFARFTGRPVDAHAGRALEDLMPVPLRVMRALQQALEGTDAPSQDVTIGKGTPQERVWTLSFTALRDEDGTRGVLLRAERVFSQHGDEVKTLVARAQREPIGVSRQERLSRLNTLALALARAHTQPEVVNVILSTMIPGADAYAGSVILKNDDGESVTVVGAAGYEPGLISTWQVIPLSIDLPATHSVREGCFLSVPHSEMAARYPMGASIEFPERDTHVMVPFVMEDRVIGAMSLTFGMPVEFAPEEQEFLMALAEVCAQALERARLLEAERHARQELASTAALLDAVLDNAPVGFAVFDAKLRFVRLNAAFANVDGASMQDHIGKRVLDYWPSLAQGLALTRETGQPRLQQEVQRDDEAGGVRTWLANYYPVKTAEGALVALGCVLTETTDLQRARQALLEGEQRFRSLVQATTAIVWNTPESGEFTSEQPGWTAFTGQRTEELLGWGWLNAVHEDDREHTARVWRRALASRTTYEVEHRLRRHDGQYRYMLARAVPILNADRNVREWVGIHTDITEHREAERAVQEGERRFRSLIEATGAFVWTRAPNGEFTTAQPGWTALTGQSTEELLGWGWLNAVHESDRARVKAEWMRAVEADVLYQIEYLVRRHDGEYRHLLVRAVPARKPDGSVSEWVGISTDITERPALHH